MKKYIFEIFDLEDLTPEEQNNLYDLYKKSYEKSVGNAWDEDKFFDRAENWYFFGDKNGYVAARLQGSGMYKLAVVGGNVRGILKGMQEINSLNKPVWGMVSDDILPMMKKLGFKTPNSLVIKSLLKIIPKEVFGGVDYKVNPNGSITLNYEDTGSAIKYFVGNQKYFDWLKSQIKDKINPLKLTNILKEVLDESKQVGNLYHYTPINYCIDILKSQYIKPNDEGQISTSRYANSETGFISHGDTNIMCRIMLDGNKISTKYKIRGFVHPADAEHVDPKDQDIMLGSKGLYAEEAIITGDKRFYLLPYVKRIDIFVEKTPTKKQQKYIETLKGMLNKMNIPYEIYQGTPKSNVPYKQSKEGDSSQFTYTPEAKPIYISIKPLLYPYKIDKVFDIKPNPDIYPVKNNIGDVKLPYIFNSDDPNINIISSPDFPNDYIIYFFGIAYSSKDFKNSSNEDYSNPITQQLLKSLKPKTLKGLGYTDYIKRSYDSLNIKSYKEILRTNDDIDYEIQDVNNYIDGMGITLIPRELIDKYFIKTPSSIDPFDYKRKAIPKK